MSSRLQLCNNVGLARAESVRVRVGPSKRRAKGVLLLGRGGVRWGGVPRYLLASPFVAPRPAEYTPPSESFCMCVREGGFSISTSSPDSAAAAQGKAVRFRDITKYDRRTLALPPALIIAAPTPRGSSVKPWAIFSAARLARSEASAGSAFSANQTCAAPRLIASMPTAPVPA